MQVRSNNCPAKTLDASQRKAIGIAALYDNVTEISKANKISRKFVYKQQDKVKKGIDKSFEEKKNPDIQFSLPVTMPWIRSLILCLILNCRSSYSGIIRTFKDMFDYKVSMGFISGVVNEFAQEAIVINDNQDLSKVRLGANDEMFCNNKPILTGLDIDSLYCYLLSKEDARDEETWAINLLDLQQQNYRPIIPVPLCF